MAQYALRRQSKLVNTEKIQDLLDASINLKVKTYNDIKQDTSKLNVSKVNFAEDMFSSDQ